MQQQKSVSFLVGSSRPVMSVEDAKNLEPQKNISGYNYTMFSHVKYVNKVFEER